MNYLKRVCLIKEYSAGFSCSGKGIYGIAKCEMLNDRINIDLSIVDIAMPQNDNFILFIGNSQKNCIYTLKESDCKFSTTTDVLDITCPFAIMLVLEKNQKIIAFGKTLDYNFSVEEVFKIYKEKSLNLFLEEQAQEKEIDNAFLYSDDVVATENYYENNDVDFNNLKIKDVYNEECKNDEPSCSNIHEEENQNSKNCISENAENFHPIQEELNTCKGEDSLKDLSSYLQEEKSCECFSVNEDVENVLNSYPRFPELEQSIYNSKWVVIALDECEYYFGKVLVGSDSYLCYAVKGERGCCPKELENLASFIPSLYSNTQGFYVMFQKE